MLKDSFCSSPWYHLRLQYDGNFDLCRWAKKTEYKTSNIKTESIMQFYNGTAMKDFRRSLLNGHQPNACSACYNDDHYGKLSGRLRQLNKSGVSIEHFDLSLRSSPHYDKFKFSNDNSGLSNYHPVDLQIDLGNVCNSACIMCNPFASSRLTVDYQKLHTINSLLFQQPKPYRSWTQDPATVDKFVNELIAIPNLRYLHFLGGETLFDETFYTICERLIDAGISKDIIVGTTTNGTIYDNRLESLITKFKEFHLGISIETVSSLNDYIRYPSNITSVLSNIKQFLSLRSQFPELVISMRITPNVFTIYEFDRLAEFLLDNSVIAESCFILYEPDCLRMELLPDDIRQEILVKLETLINKYNLSKHLEVNARRKDLVDSVISNTVLEYYNFIKTYQLPDNVEDLRYKLVDFLKSFESLRNNSILDYAPRYTIFLKHYGY